MKAKKKVSWYSINLICFDSKYWSNRKCNQSWYFLLQSFWMFIKCAAAVATAQPLMSSWHGKAVDQTGISKRFECGLMAVNSAFIPNFIVGQKVVTLMSLECTSLRGFLTNMKATQDPTLSSCLFDFLFGCPYFIIDGTKLQMANLTFGGKIQTNVNVVACVLQKQIKAVYMALLWGSNHLPLFCCPLSRCFDITLM